MTSIGVIGAMEEEVAMLKEKATIVTAKNIVGLDFYVANFLGKNVVLVVSGIGKVNAAVCTQVLIDHFGVDCIINVGIAGGLYEELKIGDVVISSDAVQHDMDASAVGDPVGTIPRMDESIFKASDALVEAAQKAVAETTNSKAYVGRVASGDVFVAETKRKNMIKELFGAYCVEMEGAAIAQTCHLNKIPFVVIRSISDNANGEAGIDFGQFSMEAAVNAAKIVECMIKDI
ncbi:MAG: 5'-methylthioadenosine/adenosylhomocysteine nucleosidase [Firmicutes bacterium]|nr:5'-methylthioadenosine/adenosylhomocysteine nucleosidase [Bacillota bacterium]